MGAGLVIFGREEGIEGCKNETQRVHDSPHLGIVAMTLNIGYSY